MHQRLGHRRPGLEFQGRGRARCQRIACLLALVVVDLLLRGLSRGLGCGGGLLLVVWVSPFRLVVRVGRQLDRAGPLRSD